MTVRWLAVIAMLCGCDGVFGLHELHLPPGADAPPDVPPSNFEVARVAFSHSSGTGTALTYPLEVPDGTDRALILSIALGSACPPGALTLANVATFSYAGMAATRLTRIQGTPCAANASSSEVWVLVNPPVGMADVVLSLTNSVPSIHGAAFLITGVDQVTPSRGCASMSQNGDAAVVMVASDPGDLVVNVVAQGKAIVGPGSNAQLVYLDNVNDFTTLNNTAASTLAGGSPDVTATWKFLGADQWQSIVCSLRPAL